jgi:hypothetical protein
MIKNVKKKGRMRLYLTHNCRHHYRRESGEKINYKIELSANSCRPIMEGKEKAREERK